MARRLNIDGPISLSDRQIQIFDGLMLGDGHLKKLNKIGDNSSLSVVRSRKDLEYLKYHYKIFENFMPPAGLVLSKRFEKTRQKWHDNCYFNTRANETWTRLRERWYPNGVKVVPDDLILTPEMIATWICDDGSVIHKPKNYFECAIYTNSFSEREVNLLIEKLEDRYKERFVKKVGSKDHQFSIYASDYAFREVIKDIDPFFPEGMERKRKWAGITDLPPKRSSKKLSKQKRLLQTEEWLSTHDEFYLIDFSKFLDLRVQKKSRPNLIEWNDKSSISYLQKYLDDGSLKRIGRDPENYRRGVLYRKTI